MPSTLLDFLVGAGIIISWMSIGKLVIYLGNRYRWPVLRDMDDRSGIDIILGSLYMFGLFLICVLIGDVVLKG